MGLKHSDDTNFGAASAPVASHPSGGTVQRRKPASASRGASWGASCMSGARPARSGFEDVVEPREGDDFVAADEDA